MTDDRPGLVRGLRHAGQNGARVRFFDETGLTQDLTHGAFIEGARGFAERLRQAGLRTGDIVAVRGGTTSEVATAIVGSILAGAITVPIVHLLGHSDVCTILDLTKARFLASPLKWRNVDYAGGLDEIAAQRPSTTVLRLGPAMSAPPAEDHPVLSAADASFILFTSGTTGTPKGVMHSYDSILAECHDFAGQLGLRPGEVFLQSFPVGHIGGLAGLLMPLVIGFDAMLLDRWNGGAAYDAIETYGVTAMGSTPYFIETLLDIRASRGGTGLRSLRSLMTGGAAVSDDLVRRADAIGVRVHRSYGLTEHPTVTASGSDAPFHVRSGSDGWPTSASAVQILDDSLSPAAIGEVGEVAIRGPEQFIGYFGGDGSEFLPGGWFRTGDIGCMRPDGTLTITGRKRDIIIRGGENISTLEVETALLRDPRVAATAVIGVPDPRFGERAYAFVVVADTARGYSFEDMRLHFHHLGLAKFKVPEWLETVADLPRNALGKVQKHRLVPRLLREQGTLT